MTFGNDHLNGSKDVEMDRLLLRARCERSRAAREFFGSMLRFKRR
ncbi:hypothetical protein [Polycladidibacter hongkongensis]|nr:hypothetical protein [Pseudovibrio hongkongensis]